MPALSVSRSSRKGFRGLSEAVPEGAKSRSRKGKAVRSTRASERRLLADARSGEAAALHELLERAAAPAWRWSSGFCRNRDDAADLVQDVLHTLLRSLERFRGDASLSTWT